MQQWLSATWAANWRSFQYFNGYRLVVSCLFMANFFRPHDWISRLNLQTSPFILGLTSIYMVAVSIGLLCSVFWKNRFNAQLSLQVAMDVLVVNGLMYLLGGVASGLSILLLISLAAASLVGHGRLVLFYAALATFGVLGSQGWGVAEGRYDQATIFQAGLISSAFFATAFLARLLGGRAMVNEELARRRGESLGNQIRIGECIVERVQDGVLIVRPDGIVSTSNPVARDMLGLPSTAGIRLAEYVPDLALALRSYLKQSHPAALTFILPDGGQSDARFEATQSSDGEILILVRDPRQIRAQALQMKLASLGRLTASIAHEIRNPLSAISHAGELLQEGVPPELQARLLRILMDNIHRLDRIVAEVLQLGRQQKINPEQIELSDFCQEVVAQIVATEHVPEDVIRVDVGESATIWFDRAHLHQVLWNLITNALRYASREAGAVNVLVSRAEEDSRIELHVKDDGPGVAAEVREQIFEPFFTTHHEGTGLGLYIARELCAANGAGLELGTAERGADFVVLGRAETWQSFASKRIRAET